MTRRSKKRAEAVTDLDPREVPDLLGRWVEVYAEGYRMARVRGIPNRRQLSVEFQAREGRHRVPFGEVRGVWFRKRVVPIPEWTAMRAERGEAE